jgi:hypothetical protein
MEDLALAYAGAIDVQALTGAGTSGTLRGIASASGLTTQTYTQASPAVAGTGQFYSMVAQAISKVYATRFLPPDTILMHPRRWAWICAAFDSSNRPLVVPRGVAMNPIATDDVNVAQGYVGNLQGLDVYVDPNLPTNLGGSSNQDPAYVFRRGDIKVWESRSAPTRSSSRTPPRRACCSGSSRTRPWSPTGTARASSSSTAPAWSRRRSSPSQLLARSTRWLSISRRSRRGRSARSSPRRTPAGRTTSPPATPRSRTLTGPAHDAKYGLERAEGSEANWRSHGVHPFENRALQPGEDGADNLRGRVTLETADGSPLPENADAPTVAPPAPAE